MWEDNIPVEVAISIVNWDKESTWNELLMDYLGEETNADSR